MNALSDRARMELNDLTDIYDSTMAGILDKNCPKGTITIRTSLTLPWFDSDCRAERRRVRMLQRRYEQSSNDSDTSVWVVAQKEMHKMFRKKKGEYWRKKVDDSRVNSEKH